jgi:hypothetical protein
LREVREAADRDREITQTVDEFLEGLRGKDGGIPGRSHEP